MLFSEKNLMQKPINQFWRPAIRISITQLNHFIDHKLLWCFNNLIFYIPQKQTSLIQHIHLIILKTLRILVNSLNQLKSITRKPSPNFKYILNINFSSLPLIKEITQKIFKI